MIIVECNAKCILGGGGGGGVKACIRRQESGHIVLECCA